MPRGKNATGPKAAKEGWMTRSEPTKPTTQAASRRGPTASWNAKRPMRRMTNGSTKTMASASAMGMTRTAATKQ